MVKIASACYVAMTTSPMRHEVYLTSFWGLAVPQCDDKPQLLTQKVSVKTNQLWFLHSDRVTLVIRVCSRRFSWNTDEEAILT